MVVPVEVCRVSTADQTCSRQERDLRAFATDDGHLLWQFNMLQDFKTVNGVAAKGGAMGAPGPVIAGGMVFAGSGYVFGGGTPGNVLLAFSPEP